MELLVHISAPTTRKDDERYRAEAFAYGEFELAGRSILAAEQDEESSRGQAQPSFGDEVRASNVPDHLNSSKIQRACLQIEQVVAVGISPNGPESEPTALPRSGVSVQYADELPAPSRNVQILQDDDFSTYLYQPTADPTWSSPLQRLEVAQKQWRKRQSLLGRSSSHALHPSDLPPNSTPDGGNLSLTENSQAAAAALESQVRPSSAGVSLGSIPSVEGGFNRPRLSQGCIASSVSGAPRSNASASQKDVSSPEQGPHTPTRDPSLQRGTLSSQLPINYSLSNSNSGNSPRVSRIYTFQVDAKRCSEATPSTHLASQATPKITTVTHSRIRAEFQVSTIQKHRSEETTIVRQQALPDPSAKSALSQTLSVNTTSTFKAQDRSDVQGVAGPPTINLPPAYFTALPREVLPPPPRTSILRCKTLPSQVTEIMTNLLSDPDLTDKYQPMYVSRDLDPTETGHWRVNTAAWPSYDQAVFWESLSDLILRGRLGFKSTLTREDWAETGRTDGLGIVKLFTWGETVRHTYLLLYAQSSGKVRHGNARWIDARGEIVVEMQR